VLHVHGGSIVLDKLRAAGLPGEFLEWVDVLCQGPTPAAVDHAAWLDVRGAFLDVAYGGTGGPARPRLAAQDATLARALTTHDEIVLWFSADWFCQAILVCLLATRLAPTSPLSRQGEGDRGRGTARGAGATGEGDRGRGTVRQTADGRWQRTVDGESGTAGISLISIGSYPGVDDRRGCTLAFLSDAQLRDLFAARRPVSAAVATAARVAWDALCAPDPRAIAAALASGLAPLPFAAEGLARHLREFPAPGTGVNRTEHRVLVALHDGPRTLAALFPLVGEQEERPWITDLMFGDVVRRLAAGPRPLVTLSPVRSAADTPTESTADAFRAARVTLTAAGREVHAGTHDWIAAAGIDRWVGGVHLTPRNDWRWDEARATLLRVGA
jgi:hypothetical protein